MDEGVSLGRVASELDAPGTYVGRRIAADRIVWACTLDRAVTWSGIVRDDRKLPIAGATVRAGDPSISTDLRSTTTGEDGRFVLKGVHEDEYELSADAPGHVRDGDFLAKGARDRIELTLPRVAAVRLRLRLPRGAAPPSWRRVSNCDPTDSRYLPWKDEFAWNDGVVEWPTWNTRVKSTLVFVPGYQVIERSVDAKPGVPVDLGDVELVEAKRVSGVVVDERLRPVPGAQVSVRVTERPWSYWLPERSVDADGEGRFEIDVAAPGERCELVVSAPGFMTTPQGLSPHQTVCENLVLGTGRMFRARLIDAPAGVWFAHLLGPNGEEYGDVRVDATGTFEVEVPLRPWSVLVTGVREDVRVRKEVDATWTEDSVLDIPMK
jgi:hypothetical protein